MSDSNQISRILIDRRPTNLEVGEKDTPPFFADIVMCVEADSGDILGAETFNPKDGYESILTVAQKALQAARARTPEGRVIWVARQEKVAQALAAHFRSPDIVLESGDSFAPWDEAYLAMDRDLAGGGAMAGYLWRDDIAPEEVAELFEVAAQFYRLRPWQFLADSELLKNSSLFPDAPPLLISVMGASGISRGLALFDSEEDFEAMMSDRDFDGVVYASFERKENIPHTVVSEAKDHGWTVASRSAFPMVTRVRNGHPVPCSGDDLRRVTAAFRALNDVTSAYRESKPKSRQRK